jgi:ionotropic glutamate receptor
VVGDLTITSDRLKIVDFTLPYLQSSLKMVAPVESKRELKPLEILHLPFSWDLWLAIAIAFVATVVSIAIVEPFEEDNEAELRRRLGKSFW